MMLLLEKLRRLITAPFAVVFFVSIVFSSSSYANSCPSGSSVILDWDAVDWPDGVTSSSFNVGSNVFTIGFTTSAAFSDSTPRDTNNHTDKTGSYGDGEEIFIWTSSGGAMGIDIATANDTQMFFSVYDMDGGEQTTITAENSFGESVPVIVEPVNSTNFLTITGSGTNSAFVDSNGVNSTTSQNFAHFNVRTLGPANKMTFSGSANVADWYFGFSDITLCEPVFDYGDAPATYGNGVTHLTGGAHYLGSQVDADEKADVILYSNDASGDDMNGLDDDDGVTIPSFIQGTSVSIPVDVKQSSASSGYLQAWIDYNGDGDFLDPGEQIASDLQLSSGTSGVINIPVAIPGTATTSPTFARFRWSTTSGLDSSTSASDGEVEDYPITIMSSGGGGGTPSSCLNVIPPGNPTAHLTSSEVTWNINGSFGSPMLLESVSVAGAPNTFSELIVPDSVSYQFATPDATNQFIRDQGVIGANITDGPATFDPALLAANSDRDLSHYFQVDGSINSTDYVQFMYNTPVISAGNRYVLISERNGNNGMGVEALDSSGQVIGSSAPITPGVTNIDTGAPIDFGQNVFFTVYPLTAIAPSGTPISGIKLTQTGATGSDGGDGKVFILVDPVTICIDVFDHGDAPAVYGDPQHTIKSDMFLGNAYPDAEDSGQPSASANIDDTTNASDEDGVDINSVAFIQGQNVTVTANVSGAGGYLQGWIDWNGDNDFTDPGEQVAVDLQLSGGSSGAISMPISVPFSATTAQTFARFRWSSTSGLDASAAATDGEVEDYALTVNAAVVSNDFGDAPTDLSSIDASLSSVYGDASHTIDSITYLGNTVDADVASQSAGLNADGDDTDGSNDDDGVTFPLAGTTRVLRVDEANTVTIQASVNGFLNAWIDWNQDGDWDDVGEQIANNQSMVTGSNSLIVTPATTAPHGATYARFRFTGASIASPSPIGAALDGEVEDYRVNLILPTPIDVCSSVIINSGFESTPNPSSYFIIPENTVEGWGTIADSPSSGANYSQRNGIEIWKSGFQGVPSFEGTYFAELNAYVPGMLYQDVELTPGSSYTWSFAHRGRSGVDTLSVLMGAPDNLQSQGNFSTGNTEWKVYGGIYIVPAGEHITRFGFQAVGSGSTGNFIDALKIPGGCDYGDAPDSYSTLRANNGAYHVANNLLYLGAQPGDSETDGLPGVAATGDDLIAVADEDGVSALGILNDLDRTYSVDTVVTNQTGDTARLIAWIDFDGNGTFDPDETAIRTIPTGTNGSTVTMNWSAIPLDIQAGNTYVRFRLTTELINNREPGGAKGNGEVEDFPITITSAGAIVSGRVYVDVNSSTNFEAGEVGIGNTVVVIHDVFTGTCRSVETTGNGDYSFNGVLDGGYEVYQAHGETTPVPQNCGTPFAINPVGYQSTTDDVLFINVASANVSDQDFGEVAGSNSTGSGNTGVGIAFDPNHQSEVLPGNIAFYSHVFTTEAEGAVRFTSSGSGNVTPGWAQTLYRDSDCNGTLNDADGNTPIEGINLGMAADSRLCIINKVFAPANVPALDQYQVTTAATFSFASSTVAPSILEVTDLTIAGQNATPSGSTPASETGASRLVLRKTVENLTQLSAETDTLNQADPGDFLKYRLYYRNTGSGPITDLIIDDVVPSYTGLVNGSNVCDVTPPGMFCTPNLNIDELNWDFTGPLVGGAKGHVSYEVMVDN